MLINSRPAKRNPRKLAINRKGILIGEDKAYPFWNFALGSLLELTLYMRTAMRKKNAAIPKHTRYTAK